MKQEILLFEPITEPQELKIRSIVVGMSQKELSEFNEAVSELAGVHCVRALSKQEAMFLIDSLLGTNKWDRPLPARTADKIKGDASHLASWRQVKSIRLWARDLGWGPEKLSNWLKKTVKVASIKKLDRESAHRAFVSMTYVLKSRN